MRCAVQARQIGETVLNVIPERFFEEAEG